MTERVLYVNLGPWPYFCGFTTSQDAFKRELRRLKVTDTPRAVKEGADAATHYLTKRDGPRIAIIYMPPPSRRRSREQYAALLSHEAVHVLQDLREGIGDLGTEAEAYIVQQIVQESLQAAWKTGRVTLRAPKP